MDIYKIAASVHVASGDWCACGEAAKSCWFLTVYRPYIQLCEQSAYERLFAAVEG